MQLTRSYDRLATHSHSLPNSAGLRVSVHHLSSHCCLLMVCCPKPSLIQAALSLWSDFFQNTHLPFPQSCLKPSVTTYYLAISSSPSTGQILTRDKAYTLKMRLGRKHSKEYLQITGRSQGSNQMW